MSQPQQPGPWDEYAKIPPRTAGGPQGPAMGQSQGQPQGQGAPDSRQPGPAQPSGPQQGAGGYVPYGASGQGAQGQGPRMQRQSLPNHGSQSQGFPNHGAPRPAGPQGPGAPKPAGMFNVAGLLAILAGGLGSIVGGATLLLHGVLPRWVGWIAVVLGVIALLLALLGLVLPAFRGRRGLAIGGAVAGVLALVLGLLSPGTLGHGGSPSAEPASTSTATQAPSPSQTPSPTPTPSWNTSEPNSTVTIELSGTTTDGSPMFVSYAYSNNLPGANETRASEYLRSQPSGWSMTVTLPVNTLKDDTYIQLSTNSEGYTGQSTCTIKVDGVVRSQQTNNNGICEASHVTE